MEKEEIIARLKEELSERRFLHSLGVAKMARDLAEKHGFKEEDCERAEKAGLVHDIAKEFSEERNRDYVEKYHLDKKLLEPEAKNYIHAEVGAEVAKELGADEEMVSAIRHHTIPKKGMTEFEKIIFLADKVGRPELDPELSKVKEMAARDIDAAMLKFLFLQKKELEKRGINPGKDTEEFAEELEKKLA